MKDKDLGIVIFGATGFTGKLIAEYMAQTPEFAKVKWAIAGRKLEKLQQLKSHLVGINDACEKVELIQADTSFHLTLVEMTRRAHVVLSTVGPYMQYGEAVVKACVETQTSYVDLTGEPPFVEMLMQKYHAQAKNNEIALVNCCGFDSIPADLGTFFTVQKLPQHEPKQVLTYIRASGKVSGGTWASALGIMGQSGDFEISNMFGRIPLEKRFFHHPDNSQEWALPMPVIDVQMVKKSSEHLPEYGHNFSYAQYFVAEDMMQAFGITLGVAGAFLAAQVPVSKDLLTNLIKSGEGPSASERATSRFELSFVGQSPTTTVHTRVSGGDPGYGETSKMVAECARLLAKIKAKDRPSGVISPAMAFGNELIEVLNKRGIRFEQDV